MALDRRQFLWGAAALPLVPAVARAAPAGADDPELHDLVMELYDSFTAPQREMLCMAGDHPRQHFLSSAWFIVPQKVGDVLTEGQQELALRVFRELHAPEFVAEVERQVAEDNFAPGVKGLSLAFFGEPGTERGLGLTFAGRHVTRRWEQHATDPFSGTVFYGHACTTFHELPHHPGNVYWSQGVAANELLNSLDKRERKAALAGGGHLDRPECLERPRSRRGVSFADLDGDRLGLARKLVHEMVVRPFRPRHAARALEAIEANGGLASLQLHFFRKEDYGADGVYDNYEVWGPKFLCHFRGAPHSHCWLRVQA